MSDYDTLKIHEIASRLDAHLKRFAGDDALALREGPDGSKRARFWQSGAYAAGAKVMVCYVYYQGHRPLAKAEAAAYLAWLDAGNVGKHTEVQAIQTS